MIKYEGSGDIFSCDSQTICCPVNSVGVMGKGLALEFSNKVPGLLEFYQRHYSSKEKTAHNRLQTYKVPDGRQVLLFPTKIHWADRSPLGLIDTNLEILARSYAQMNIRSLALPMLGCGLGRLSYASQVRPLIIHHLEALPLPVSVYFK